MDPLVMRLLSGENKTIASSTTGEGEGALDDDYYSNKWLLIVPRITGTISLFAVCCVAMEAWMDIRARRREENLGGSGVMRTRTAKNLSTITNIQLFYQLPLFCFSLALALGTTPAPMGQTWGAFGNVQTCSAQGFLLQFGMYGLSGWDATLSTAYLMMVRYKVSDFRLQSRINYLHYIIWPVALVASIYPLIMEMYNLNGSLCWLEPYPRRCDEEEEELECQRGGSAATMWQLVSSSLVFLHLLYTISVMVLLYRAVRALERHNSSHHATAPSNATNSRRSNPGSLVTSATNRRRRYSRKIAVQGLLYASGMVITALPTPIYILLWNVFGIWSDGFSIFATSLVPLVGYVNFVIFMRCRSVENCKTTYGKLLRKAHSWLFDYEVNCRINCRRKPDTEGSMIPDLQEVANDRDSKTKASTAPRWSNFLIGIQRKSQMPRVSDLGDSDGFEFDGLDEAPSLPKRVKSGIEKPPTQPVRLVSEIEGNSIATNKILEKAPIRPVRLVSEVAHGADAPDLPPQIPARQISEFERPQPHLLSVLDSVLEEIDQMGAPELSERYCSGLGEVALEPTAEEIRRLDFVSEITVDDELHEPTGTTHEGPPIQPLRCISELEMDEDEKVDRPQRKLSAVLEVDSHHTSAHTPRTRQSRFENEVPDATDSVASQDGASFALDTAPLVERAQGPPSRPTRLLSEVEIPVESSDCT